MQNINFIADNSFSFFILLFFVFNLCGFIHYVYYMESKYVRDLTDNILDYFGIRIT